MRCVSPEMRVQLRSPTPRSAALFALVFALLFSASLAGRQRSFLMDQDSLRQQEEGPEAEQNEALAQVHARMLKAVATSDYGSYDPTPTMDKPHFKLIPN